MDVDVDVNVGVGVGVDVSVGVDGAGDHVSVGVGVGVGVRGGVSVDGSVGGGEDALEISCLPYPPCKAGPLAYFSFLLPVS